RVADPRNHHRPAFDATVAVDAVLQRRKLQQGVDIKFLRLIYIAFDRNRPRPRAQALGQVRRRVLVGAEFVEVVVIGDVFVGRLLLIGRKRALNRGKLGSGLDRRWRRNSPQTLAGDRGAGSYSRSRHELAAVHVNTLRGDFGREYVGGLLDQHKVVPIIQYVQIA